MSTELVAIAAAPKARALDDPRTRRILRLVITVTLATAYSCYINWSYSFLLPCLMVSMMGVPTPAPAPGYALATVAKILGCLWFGVVLMLPLHNQQIFGLFLVGFILFVYFYFQAQGKVASVNATFLIFGVTLVPAFGQNSISTGIEFAKGMSQSALALFPIIWIAFAMLPEEGMLRRLPKAPRVEGTPVERAIVALRPVALLLPVFVFMLSSDNNIRYLIGYYQVAMIAQHANRATATTLAVDLLFATVIGCTAGLVLWWVMKLWPSLFWFTLMMALVTYFFATRTFGNGPRGLTSHYLRWSYAITTLLLTVLPPAMTQGFTGDDPNKKFLFRILDYLLITSYSVVGVLIYDAVVERLSALRKRFSR